MPSYYIAARTETPEKAAAAFRSRAAVEVERLRAQVAATPAKFDVRGVLTSGAMRVVEVSYPTEGSEYARSCPSSARALSPAEALAVIYPV